jgi:hypothetical protein
MMKKRAFVLAVLLSLSLPAAVMSMDHGSMHGEHEHGSMVDTGVIVHEETIDGVRTVFKITNIEEAMHGMAVPKDLKETHHMMVMFTDAKTGKGLADGEVRAKIQGPGGKDQMKSLVGMEGHFGADFDLSAKGKYGVMVKFKLADGKVRSAQFWYTVK